MTEVECLRLRVAGEILRLPSDCVLTAMTLYRRYRKYMSHDPRILAACLFCATKLEEAECRTVDLVNVMRLVSQNHHLKALCPQLGKDTSNNISIDAVLTGEDYYSEKAALIGAEHRLLRTINFDVVVAHPQRELLTLCVKLNISTEIVSTALRLMNDTIAYTDLILKYESSATAASVLYTAMLLMDVDPDGDSRGQWYEEIGLDVEVVEGLGHDIVDMLMDIRRQAPMHS